MDAHDIDSKIITISNNGDLIATAGGDHLIKLWDFKTGKFFAQSHIHSKDITSLGFTFDDRQLFSTASDGNIALWNVFAV